MTHYLLDVNVLIPLIWPRHIDQPKVEAWFRANAIHSFATCSFTPAGVLRLTRDLEIVRQLYTLTEARQLLLNLTKLEGHAFWPTTISYFEATAPFVPRMHGPKQVTDGYLLGIAGSHGGELATMDKAIKSLAGPEHGDLVELIA